jgi:hypothetical protein
MIRLLGKASSSSQIDAMFSPNARSGPDALAPLRGTRWGRKAIIVGAGVACLTVFGPFATYAELPYAVRALYWLCAMTGVGIFMHLAIWPALHAARLAALPRVLVLALASSVAAIPGAGIVYLCEAAFRSHLLEGVNPVMLWPMVALMGMVVGSVDYWEELFGANRLRPAAAPPPSQALPPELRGDLISLSMQDHYAAITGNGGTRLVHMRFADALDALGTTPGTRIHRSHWIAAGALVSIERDGGKPHAVLTDGRRLPISRPYLGAARTLLRGPGSSERPGEA